MSRWFRAIALFALGPLVAGAAPPAWELIDDDAGIKVWRREVAGSSFVEFRARGVIDANILAIGAVLRNANREQEWMEGCVEARYVELKGVVDAIEYNRTGAPAFFIADRDTVIEAKTTVRRAEKTIQVDFKNIQHPRVPPVDGVVRMPLVAGHWLLHQLTRDRTEVEYEVHADPGGSLPGWLVNWASKSLPLDTILAARKQVKQPGYEQDRLVLARGVDWTGFEIAETSSSATDLSGD